MIQRHLPYIITFFLVSCGTQESEAVEDIVEDSDTVEVVEDIPNFDYVPPHPDSNWTVKDYAESYLQYKILEHEEIGNQYELDTFYFSAYHSGEENYMDARSRQFREEHEFLIFDLDDSTTLFCRMSEQYYNEPKFEYEFALYNKSVKIKDVADKVIPFKKMEAHRDTSYAVMSDMHHFGELKKPLDYAFDLTQRDSNIIVDALGHNFYRIPIYKLKWNGEKFVIQDKLENRGYRK